MTTKNAILLIVKQTPGIDYNTLLTKFAASYSNANSARAALSRSLKDLTTFGFAQKRDNKYFLLEKGELEIYSEIKNKLVIALNSVMKARRPADEIDSIVEKLQILVERVRQEKDLLKTSRSSLDFSINDLEGIANEISKKRAHLEFVSKVFADQISALKDLGFNDRFSRPVDDNSLSGLSSLFISLQENEFMVESQNVSLIATLAEKLSVKPRTNAFTLPKDLMLQFLNELNSRQVDFSSQPLNLFSSLLKAQFISGKVVLSGPYSEITKWKI